MIKSLIAGVWAIALFMGALYFFNAENGYSELEASDDNEYLGKLETVKLDPMSITIIRNNALQGYVLLDVSFTIKPENKTKLSIPPEVILKDAINNSVFGNEEIDINNLKVFDFEKFKSKTLSDISDKYGKNLINDILIERIDFISGETIRDKKLRG